MKMGHTLLKILLSLLVLFDFHLSRVTAQPGPIKNLRYNDDFNYLLSDSVKKEGLDKLKYLPLFKRNNSHLSFGGEVREWYEIRRNPNFGDLPPGSIEDPNGALQHRLMLHADLQLNDRFRLFTQLNNTLEFGNPHPVIPEIIEDGLGLHQFFADVNFGNKGNETSDLLRLGRQEYSFGNELVISSREGPNNRLAFDGVTFIHQNDKHQINLLAATPVIIEKGVFDNAHESEAIWGTYAYLRKQKKTHLDLYYFGFYAERRAYNFIPGDQHRHTVGARMWNHGSGFYYEVETMYQLGDFNGMTINAFNFTGELRYVFRNKFWKPMIGLGASYISGDRSSNDNQLNTYDPLYPKPVYGLATPQGPSNISHLKPTFGVQPIDNLVFNFDWYLLVRTSVNDGTYAPSMIQVRPFPNTSSDDHTVGNQFALDIFYFINQNWSFITFISYVKPGDYVKDTGAGKKVFFWASTFQFKF